MDEQTFSTANSHLEQIDILRVMPMLGVVLVHTIAFTQPGNSISANGLLMLLHTNRYVFFFITSFVLFYSTRNGTSITNLTKFWKKRFPLVLIPFVVWTIIYWQLNKFFPWGDYPNDFSGALLQLGQYLITGWYHLYFLLVTMQFYIVFPFFARLLKFSKRWLGLIFLLSATLEALSTWFLQYDWSAIPNFLQPILSYSQVNVISYQFYFLSGAVAAIYLAKYLTWVRTHLLTVAPITLALTLFGISFYFFNLSLGFSPQQASSVFQPAMLAIFAGVVGILWCLGEYLMKLKSSQLLRYSRLATELSFGVYLVHMLPLQILMLPAVQSALNYSWFPSALFTLTSVAIVVLTTLCLVFMLRLTPLSSALTGRPQYRFAYIPMLNLLDYLLPSSIKKATQPHD